VVSDSLETIKKDVEEIEDAVVTVEDELVMNEMQSKAQPQDPVKQESADQDGQEDTKSNVESLFVKSTTPVTPDITVVGRGDKTLGVWIGATLGVVMAVGVTLLFVVNGPPSFLTFPPPAPTPTPTMAPKPTPTKDATIVKREDVTISVLNGAGVPGAAKTMKEYLESKGYVVESVGNADEYTYTETMILVKDDDDEIAALLRKDLGSDYTVASKTGDLDTDATFDAQVIVGAE